MDKLCGGNLRVNRVSCGIDKRNNGKTIDSFRCVHVCVCLRVYVRVCARESAFVNTVI